MAKTKKDEPALLQIPVSFGGASTGDKTARIGIHIARGAAGASFTAMERNFSEKRIRGHLLGRSNGGPDQEALPGMEADAHLTGTFDVKGISFDSKKWSFGLTFARSEIGDGALDPFVKREGTLTITEVSAIPEDQKTNDEGEE